MSTKNRWSSLSKRRPSTSETHYRVVGLGGLVPINTSFGIGDQEATPLSPAKSTSTPRRRRPPNLKIIPPDYKNNHLNHPRPASTQQNGTFVRSASTPVGRIDGMLPSSALAPDPTVRPTVSASIHKPLPSRPRSTSLPFTPNLPAELPGSILLENQGFPSPTPVVDPASSGTIKSVYSGNAVSSTARPTPAKVPQHKKSLGETNLKKRSKSRADLITSSSTDSRLAVCSESPNESRTSSTESVKASIALDAMLQPSPMFVKGKPQMKHGGGTFGDQLHVPITPRSRPLPTGTADNKNEELKATITAQDQTISTLQAQFTNLRISHEVHVSSLVNAHAAEVASLKNYTKSLEEQQKQRSLHHASSNHLLFLLDTTDTPQSPSTTASTIQSAVSTPVQPPKTSPRRGPLTPEMDQLKRMMVNVRRPEVDTNNLVRERNLYREKCKEYADQIGNLMATLNQYQEEGNKSKKIAANLQIVRKELEKKASKIAQLEKSTLALQNTINHLEYRLEIANADKLDAQEQLYNMKMKKSAFDVDSNSPPLAQKYQTTDISLNTVFTEESEVYASPEIVPKDLAPFIARIERLEKDLQQKKVRSAARENLIIFLHTRQSELEDLVQQKNRLATRLEARVENMNLLLDEKDRARRQAEHKVDHYKIMIEAAIRRNGVIAAVLDDVAKEGYLPDLATLVSKKDIDCWMEQLYTQLKKYKAAQKGVTHVNSPEAIIKDQRNEIDFYVREIIYYKLDIRGYKSDIKQLKQEMQLKKDNQSIQSSDAGSRDCSSSRLVSPGLEGLKASVLSEKKKPTPKLPEQKRFDEFSMNFVPANKQASQREVSSCSTSVKEDEIPKVETAKPGTTPESQHHYSASEPGISKGKTTPERPRRPNVGLFEPSVGEIQAGGVSGVPSPPRKDVMAEAMRNLIERAESTKQARRPSNASTSSATKPLPTTPKGEVHARPSTADSAIPLHLRSRSREEPTTSFPLNSPHPQPSDRRPSTSSSTNTPFVIGMGSPHNPAFMSPAIGAAAAAKISSPILRTGVGGTMASTTPVSSPVSPPRNMRSPYFGGGGSGSKIPGKLDFMKGKGKARKGSVSEGEEGASGGGGGGELR